MKNRDLYKHFGKQICHFQVVGNAPMICEKTNGIPLTSVIKGFPVLCGDTVYDTIDGVPLCKCHAEYARFMGGK